MAADVDRAEPGGRRRDRGRPSCSLSVGPLLKFRSTTLG